MLWSLVALFGHADLTSMVCLVHVGNYGMLLWGHWVLLWDHVGVIWMLQWGHVGVTGAHAGVSGGHVDVIAIRCVEVAWMSFWAISSWNA